MSEDKTSKDKKRHPGFVARFTFGPFRANAAPGIRVEYVESRKQCTCAICKRGTALICPRSVSAGDSYGQLLEGAAEHNAPGETGQESSTGL